MSNRVVVTGIGIWSCLGTNVEEVKESLRVGKSGIVLEQERLDYGYHSGLTGAVPKPKLKNLLDRRVRMGMSEESEYAFMASKEAFDMARIDDDYLRNNEVGVIFGNDSSAKAVIECQEIINKTHDSELIGSGNIFQSMNSTVNMNMSTIFHLRGINFSVSAACASGSHSIGLAYMFIKQGLQDVVLCGGAQEVNKYAMVSFDALGTFSQRLDDPQKASRPFDRDRDGLVPSGGAAALVLESYEHAVSRGATIIAEIGGYGFSSNGSGVNQPSDEGSYVAMSRALQDAGILPQEVDYVNAHATSTSQGDMCEAIALSRLFAAHNTPVSSTKSMTGHECWMAGASEAVYSIIMMQNGFIAPNINFENPDEYSEKLNIVSATQTKKLNIVLSNSFGFGGTNSAIVMKSLRV